MRSDASHASRSFKPYVYWFAQVALMAAELWNLSVLKCADPSGLQLLGLLFTFPAWPALLLLILWTRHRWETTFVVPIAAAILWWPEVLEASMGPGAALAILMLHTTTLSLSIATLWAASREAN